MYSQMDAPSLFSGGGFMPSQATQVPDSGASPARVRAVAVSCVFVHFPGVSSPPRSHVVGVGGVCPAESRGAGCDAAHGEADQRGLPPQRRQVQLRRGRGGGDQREDP